MPDQRDLDLPEGELAESEVTLDEMLDAVPLEVTVWHDVDLSSPDPAFDSEMGRRRCIATRKAGGRCLTTARLDGLLCNAHGGFLDSATGGHALAEKRRQARISEEEKLRLARLGARGVIADTLGANAQKVQKTVQLLLDSAAQGDLASAKLLVPYLNQGLGLPTERVEVTTPQSAEEVGAMSTPALLSLVRERRRQAIGETLEPERAAEG